ncbi:hypothetical protein U1Q18_031295 [Sarracenia purpurea var. burkii]
MEALAKRIRYLKGLSPVFHTEEKSDIIVGKVSECKAVPTKKREIEVGSLLPPLDMKTGVEEGLVVQDNSPIPVIFPALETVEGSEVELKKEVVGLQGGEMEDVSSDLDGTGSAVVGGLEQVAAVKQGTSDSSLPTQMSSVRGLLSDLTIPSSRGLDEYDGLGNKGTMEQETKKAPKVQFDGDCAGQVFSPNLPFRSVFIAGDCCEGVDLMRSSGGASMDKQTGDWLGILALPTKCLTNCLTHQNLMK